MIAAAHAQLDSPPEAPETPDAPETSEVVPTLSSRRRTELRDRCMTELSRLDRLIVVLYYYEQLTTREVAAVLELPEDQIETRRAGLARRLGKLVTE